jgi:tetratricopeptide (TPR) repeat protein
MLVCVALLGLAGCGRKAEVTSLQRKTAANLVSEAQFAVTLRDYARAEGLYAQAAEVCPDTGDYWLNLGVMRKRLNNRSGAKAAYARAADAFRDAYERDPKQPELVLQQVNALALLGKTDDARATLEKARKKHPENRTIRVFVENGQLERMLSDPTFKELAL